MDLKEKKESQRLPEGNYEVSQSQIEQTKREAHEIFSKKPVEDFTRETEGEVKQHTEIERTPGLATRVALNRVKADLPIAGPTSTDELAMAQKKRESEREVHLEGIALAMRDRLQPAPPALRNNDVNTLALAKDVEKGEIRDFFNKSYSGSDSSIIKVETNFKHEHAHEWREEQVKNLAHAGHITSDRTIKSAEYAGIRNMANTHKREIKESMSNTRPALEAKHKLENSLFDLQKDRFQMQVSEGQEIGVNEVHLSQDKMLKDYAQYKSLKTKLPVEAKLDMRAEYIQVSELDQKPKQEQQAPKQDMKHLWSQVKVEPIRPKMKMTQ